MNRADHLLAGRVVHVLGHGRFGRHAVQALARLPVKGVVVVDRARSNLGPFRLPEAADPGPGRPVFRVQADAVAHVASMLHQPDGVDHWLVPTLPLHLAAEVACHVTGWRKSTWDRPPMLPNQVLGPTRDLYSSLADFRCPDDCPGPAPAPAPSTWDGAERDGSERDPDADLVCPLTGEIRDLPGRLAHADFGNVPSRLIVSHQLAPGVGGYPLEALAEVVSRLRATNRKQLVLHTASACHGVSSLLATD